MNFVYIVQNKFYGDFDVPIWKNIGVYTSKEDAKEFIQSKKCFVTKCEFCLNNFNCDNCDNITNETSYRIDIVKHY